MVGTRANQTVRSGRISESDRPIARSGSIWSGPRPLQTDGRINGTPGNRSAYSSPSYFSLAPGEAQHHTLIFTGMLCITLAYLGGCVTSHDTANYARLK